LFDGVFSFPQAAAGLMLIMIGAVLMTLMGVDVVTALIPLVMGLLSAFVAMADGAEHPTRLLDIE
jgi:hypothetical protein